MIENEEERMIGHAETPAEREQAALIVMREQMRSIMEDLACSEEQIARMEASIEVREVTEAGELLFGFDVPSYVYGYLDALRDALAMLAEHVGVEAA
jgi:hypothetical protein